MNTKISIALGLFSFTLFFLIFHFNVFAITLPTLSVSSITLSGTGYKPDTTIYVTWDESQVYTLTKKTSSNGSFKVNFPLPSGANIGTHTVRTTVDGVSGPTLNILTSQASPSPSPSPSPTPNLLEDNFNGASLNSETWETFVNGGNVNVADGFVTLSAGSAMPYIRAINNPIPTSGPFDIDFGIQYLARAEGGNGVAISFLQQPNITPGWENTPLALWQDNVGFGLVGFGSYLLTISPSDLNYHNVKISYDGTKYMVRVDGNLVYTSPNTARAGALWFGHPNYCCTSGWTSFKLDYIKVTSQ